MGQEQTGRDASKAFRCDFIRALAINVKAYGRDRPLALPIGITLSNLAGVIGKEADRTVECVAIYREVVEAFEARGHGNGWMVGSALTDLAESLIIGNVGIEEARQILTRAVHILLTTRGLDHPSTRRAENLLRECAKKDANESACLEEDRKFVETLLDECEHVFPKGELKVSGDIVFLDRRGHVGFGHPHTPLV